MRLFLALAFGGTDLGKLVSAVEAARPELTARGWRVLPPENWHLTLLFLGEASAERASEVMRRVEQIPLKPLELTGLEWGAPGGGKRPAKTFGLVFGPSESLMELHRHSVQLIGEREERRPFRSHITVARRREAAMPPRVSEAAPCSLAPSRLVLFRSELLPNGAKHTPLVERVMRERA